MEKENTFSYTYSARDNQEVLEIRKKYLPRQETKLEELKRLDTAVQTSGIAEGLSIGVTGCLLFGIGFCLAMQVLGNLPWLGIPVGLAGVAVMCLAYPVYRHRFSRMKARYTPRILELAEELSTQS